MATPGASTLTFAGVDLTVYEDNQDTFFQRAIPLSEYAPFDAFKNYFSDAEHLPLPAPRRQTEIAPGTLHWPVGAARWAVCHWILDSDKLADIDAALSVSGSGTLTISSGSGSTITATMYMLPPRPVVGGPTIDTEPLWIITLVDERFYWWMKLATINTVPSSWSNLFSTLGTALGVTIEGDTTIEGAYGTPTERWLVQNMPAGAVLDAAAESVGRRVVRRHDGTVRLERPETAFNFSQEQYEDFWLTRELDAASGFIGSVIAGGRIASSHVVRSVPAAVRSVFGKKVDGVVVTGQYSIGINLNAMGLSGYGSAAGIANMASRFTADAYALWAGVEAGDPANLSTLSALAIQAAADWYGWRRGNIDINYAGVVPWVPDGISDQVRWTFDLGDVSTRVMRDPFFDWNVYGYYPVVGSGGGSQQKWGKVEQILSGQKYLLRQVVASGTNFSNLDWVTPSNPLVVTGFRADSADYDEIVLPFIPVGQQVPMWPSATVTGLWEIPAWGGQRKTVHRSLWGVCGHCDASGNIIVSALVQKMGFYARDLRTVRMPTGTAEYQIDLSGAGY